MANEFIARNGLIAQNNSTVSGSLTVTAGITGSLLGTSSYAATSSYADNFTVAGTLTAQTLVVQTITSSIVYSSGSNIFGNALANTQKFTGSLFQTGSVAVFMGNVGVGTTSPGYKLDVQSGSVNFRYDQPSATSYTYFRNWATGGSVALLLGNNDSDDSSAEIILSNNALYLQAYGDPGSSIQFGTRNSSTSAVRMKIDQDGNVGIGTTSPSAKLHTYLADGANDNTLRIQQGTNAYAAGLNIVAANDGGAGYNFITSNTNGGTEHWRITGGAAAATLAFWTSGSEKVRINPSGDLLVGTATSIWGSANRGIAQVNGASTSLIGLSISDQAKAYLYHNGADLALYTYTGNINFQNSNGDVLSVSGTNVGIGSTAPGYKLDVSGSGRFTGGLTLTSENPQLTFTDTTAGEDDMVLSMNGDYLEFLSNALRNIITVHGETSAYSGSVGIGITNPSSKLSVAGNIYAQGANNSLTLRSTSGNTTAIELSDGTSYGYLIKNTSSGTSNGALAGALYTYTDSSKAFQHIHSGTPLFTILSSGNVGIGTASPATKLFVAGTVRANGTDGQVDVDPTSGAFRFYDGSTFRGGFGTDAWATSGNASDLTTYLNGGNYYIYSTSTSTKIFTALAGGNVGIGLTNPSYKLDVNGTTRAPKIYLDRVNTVASGISWYSPSYYAWTNYMSPATQTSAGPSANITAPSGTLVTSWALRSYIENVSGYGWTFESAANTATPSVVAEIRASDGSARFAGGVTAASFTGSFSGSLSAPGSTTQVLYNNAGTIAGDSGLIYSGSKVGIGTTSPVTQLQVVGGYVSTKDNAAYGGAFLEGGNGITYFGSLGSDDIQLYTGGATKVTIKQSSGNVGIGTTNPGAKLDVAGNVRVQNGYNMVIGDTVANPVASTSPAALTLRKFTSGNASTVVSASYYLGVGGNEYDIGSYRLIGLGYSETSTVTTYPSYIGYKEVSTAGYTYGDLIFGTRSTTGATDDPSERMRITYDGKVGIGTTNPANKLVVTSDATYNNENSYAIASAAASDPAYKTIIGYDYANDIGVIAAVRTSIGWKNISIPQGSVGIGTLSPSAKLHVLAGSNSTSMLLDHGSSADRTYFGFDGTGNYIETNGATTAKQRLRLQVYNSSTTVYTQLYIDGGNNVIYTSATANVGIGTTNPAYKLQVVGAGNTGGVVAGFAGTGPSGSITIAHSANGGNIGYANVGATNNLFYVTTGAGTIGSGITMDNNGNVGIGTTNPDVKLQVVGDIRITANDPILYLTPNSGTGVFFQKLSTSNGNFLRLYDGTNYSMFWKNANIGIGTTDPTFKLDIAGSTRITDSGYAGIEYHNTAGTWEGYIGTEQSAGNLRYNSRLGNHTWYSSSIATMILTSAGNLGIGSTAPTQGKLVVNGGVYATSFTGSFSGTIAGYLPLAGGTMAGTLQMSNQILAFDQSGVRSWGVQASGGELNFTSGDSAGVFDFGTSVNVTGTLTATVKSFVIDHPTKADKKLQYGVLEGPEHSVYVRGKLKNTNYIPLPDYWHALVHQDSITVTVTAIGKKQDIWVNEVTEHGIYLGYEGNTVEYFYTVFAERKDIGKLVTEFDKEI